VANAWNNMDGNSPFMSTSMRPAVAFERLKGDWNSCVLVLK